MRLQICITLAQIATEACYQTQLRQVHIRLHMCAEQLCGCGVLCSQALASHVMRILRVFWVRIEALQPLFAWPLRLDDVVLRRLCFSWFRLTQSQASESLQPMLAPTRNQQKQQTCAVRLCKRCLSCVHTSMFTRMYSYTVYIVSNHVLVRSAAFSTLLISCWVLSCCDLIRIEYAQVATSGSTIIFASIGLWFQRWQLGKIQEGKGRACFTHITHTHTHF